MTGEAAKVVNTLRLRICLAVSAPLACRGGWLK